MLRLSDIEPKNLHKQLHLFSGGQRFVLCLLMSTIVFVCFFGFKWSLQIDQAKQNYQDINSRHQSLDRKSELLLMQPDLEKRLATLRYQLPELQKSLPTERQVADLLSRINMVIQSENTLLQEFVPQPSVAMEIMQVVPVRVVAYGIGESLAQFPNRLAKLSRQVNLKNFEIVSLENNSQWKLTGTIQAYTQLSSQPSSIIDTNPGDMLNNPAVVSVPPIKNVVAGDKK